MHDRSDGPHDDEDQRGVDLAHDDDCGQVAAPRGRLYFSSFSTRARGVAVLLLEFFRRDETKIAAA